jgi:hypothetical protein
MLTSERGVLTNSLWRELLDYLPVAALLFRIDENDQARLIFANREIEHLLGYAPGDYVLESESEGRVRQEMDALTDRIAGHSQSAGKGTQPAAVRIELTSRFGGTDTFGFDYRIFRSKSGNHPFIAVTLIPAADVSANTGSISFQPESPEGSINLPAAFSTLPATEYIAGSAIMKGILNKADFVATHPVHGWITGEKGTGRTSTAMLVADMTSARLADVARIRCDADTPPDLENWHVQGRCGTVILIIDDAERLRREDFDAIDRRISTWEEAGISAKILITSDRTPDSLHEAGLLPDKWMYSLAFTSLHLPPLKQRAEDVKAIAEWFATRISGVLGLEEPVWDEPAVDQLYQHTWPGNITELRMVIGQSLIAGAGRKVRLITGVKEARTAAEGAFRVIPFDEMSALYLRRVLEHTGGKIYGKDGAAALLGLKPTTLQSKLIKLGVR